MTFNPHQNRTSDGVLITEGLRVFTNNFDRGRIIGKAWNGDHPKPNDWWWNVELDTDYQGRQHVGVAQMNGERMATQVAGESA